MVVALRLGPPEKGKTQLAKEEATAFYLSEYNTNNATNGYVEEYQDAYTSAFECIDSYRIENLSTCFECEQYKYTNPRAYTDCKQLNNCYGYSSCLECEAFTAEAKDSCQLANNCAICQECIEAPESELLECQLQNNCLVTAPYSCTEVLNNYYQANTIANVHLAIKAKSQAIVAQNLANGVYNNSSYYFDGPTPKPHTIAALNVPAITQSTQYTNYLNSYYNQVDWQAELLPLVNQEQLTLHYMPQVEQLWLAEAETKAQLSDTSVAGVLKTMAILANQPASNYKVPELLESLNHLYGPTAGQYLLNTNGASTQQQKPIAFLQYNLTKITYATQIVTTAGPNVYYLYGSSRLGEQKHFAGKSNAQTYHQQHGSLTYEFTDHLGNVKLTTNNRLKLHYRNTAYHLEPTLLSSVDYYAFGMVMPGRTYNIGQYRFGHNGKEMDNEVNGAGNWYDYGARPYDPRIGRPPSIDPLAAQFPMLSPYQFFSNNPIWFIDLNGMQGTTPDPNTGETQIQKTDWKLVGFLAKQGFKLILVGTGAFIGTPVGDAVRNAASMERTTQMQLIPVDFSNLDQSLAEAGVRDAKQKLAAGGDVNKFVEALSETNEFLGENDLNLIEGALLTNEQFEQLQAGELSFDDIQTTDPAFVFSEADLEENAGKTKAIFFRRPDEGFNEAQFLEDVNVVLEVNNQDEEQ